MRAGQWTWFVSRCSLIAWEGNPPRVKGKAGTKVVVRMTGVVEPKLPRKASKR